MGMTRESYFAALLKRNSVELLVKGNLKKSSCGKENVEAGLLWELKKNFDPSSPQHIRARNAIKHRSGRI
jgi:hypothetical protein